VTGVDVDAVRAELAAAMAGVDCDPGLDSRDAAEIVSALLPVVDRIATARAAAELRAAADRIHALAPDLDWDDDLRDRADALDPS
jgi:hypothetical protein